MKQNRHGKASPLLFSDYCKLRQGFLKSQHQLILDIAYATGERWGAILRLTVSDIYSDPIQAIPHQDITFRKATRKDKETRQCPVSSGLELRLRAYRPPVSGYLFPSPYAIGCHLGDRSADMAMRRAIVRAGLSDRGFSTHSTRRGLINRLHNAGTSIKVIQAITGHKSLSVLSGYIDISDRQKRNAIEVA